MNPDEIALVQGTWRQVVPIKETAAELFYGKLFELDQTLKPLFEGDIKEQGRKLMTMITIAVNGLTQLDALVPAVQDLGRRHAAHSFQDVPYGAVADALLWTLEEGLGAAFTPEVKAAWSKAYGVLADTMRQAASSAAA
jgi:hemoglobin-like flavoprotein